MSGNGRGSSPSQPRPMLRAALRVPLTYPTPRPAAPATPPPGTPIRFTAAAVVPDPEEIARDVEALAFAIGGIIAAFCPESAHRDRLLASLAALPSSVGELLFVRATQEPTQ